MTKARDLADSADKDIAGTLTVDAMSVEGDLTVDTDTLYVDSTNNRVGVGTVDPQYGALEVRQSANADENGISVRSAAGTRAMRLWVDETTSYIGSGDTGQFDLVLNEGGGSVGIGNTAPTHNLHVTDTGTPNLIIETTAVSSEDAKLRIRGARTTSVEGDLCQILFETNDEDSAGGNLAFITAGKDVASTNKGVIRFGTTTTDGGNPTEHLRITSDGNVLPNSAGTVNLGAEGNMFANVWTSGIKTSNNVLRISVDEDASGSNQAIYFREGGVTRLSLEDNDVYVSDNISSGLRYEAAGANRAYDTTSSHISAYAANYSDPDTSGFQSYRTFIQAYNTTDPDVAVFQAFSKDVMADTGATTHSEKSTSHMMDNGGRSWHWNSVYAGRVRVGSTATTTAYRAGDNQFTAYSGTGNAHGATTNAGFTTIIGRESANGDDVFLVQTAGQHRIEFDASGNGRFDGGADISAADYAEYFEWQDGNPNNEDRRGHSVVLNSDGKIRIATASDPVDDIIGIVSVEAAVVGDSAWAAWTGKYERDRFGQTVYEDYDLLCWGPYDEESKSYKTQTTRQAMIDAGREDEIPEDAITVTKRRKKLAADYDPDREYIPRKDRQEWVAIGLMGKLPLLGGQPTGPRWRKLFDLNDEVEMWLVR